jgi:hypothetical protein
MQYKRRNSKAQSPKAPSTDRLSFIMFVCIPVDFLRFLQIQKQQSRYQRDHNLNAVQFKLIDMKNFGEARKSLTRYTQAPHSLMSAPWVRHPARKEII